MPDKVYNHIIASYLFGALLIVTQIGFLIRCYKVPLLSHGAAATSMVEVPLRVSPWSYSNGDLMAANSTISSKKSSKPVSNGMSVVC